MRAEIEAAKRLRDARTGSWEDMIRGYHGPSYDDGAAPYESENTAYEVVSGVNPKLVFQNPRVKLGSSRPEYQSDTVTALELAINRWIKDSNPRELFEEVATDFQFAFGVVCTRQVPAESARREGQDADDPVHRPRAERVSPREFVADPRAKTFRSSRWMGHPVSMDKDDLQTQATEENAKAREEGRPEPWNLHAIMSLVHGEGENEVQSDDDVQNAPHRNTVTFYVIWVPELQLEDSPGPSKGFNGSLVWVTLSDVDWDDESNFIHKPEPFYGPRWGPYSFFKPYYVPDRQHPLAVLPATYGQHLGLNRVAEANIASIERRKTITFVDDLDPDIQEKVEEAPDGSVVPAKMGSVRDGIKEVELGSGPTAAALQGEAIQRDRRDRAVSISGALQSNPNPDVSATADVISNAQFDVKMAHLQTKFQVDGVAQMLKTVLWYLFADDRTVIYLGEAGQKALGVSDPVYVGGEAVNPEGTKERLRKEFPGIELDDEMLSKIGEGKSIDNFDLLELEIEPYSMMRSDEPMMQARAMQGFQVATQIAPLIVQTPWIDWELLMDRMGDAMNWPGFGNIIKKDVAMAITAQMLEADPAALSQPNQAQGKPRLAGDVSGGKGQPFSQVTR